VGVSDSIKETAAGYIESRGRAVEVGLLMGE
jgi:hypothetical protein